MEIWGPIFQIAVSLGLVGGSELFAISSELGGGMRWSQGIDKSERFYRGWQYISEINMKFRVKNLRIYQYLLCMYDHGEASVSISFYWPHNRRTYRRWRGSLLSGNSGEPGSYHQELGFASPVNPRFWSSEVAGPLSSEDAWWVHSGVWYGAKRLVSPKSARKVRRRFYDIWQVNVVVNLS